MPTVLVTGGSGFLGINLIRFLLSKGFKVRSLDLEPFEYPERDRVEVIVGDVRNVQDVQRSVSGVDFVVHCAAALPLYAREEIFSTDVEGTRTVLQAALDAKVERVVHISSTAVYGVPDHHPIVETDRLVGVGPYGEAKIEAEKICAEFRSRGLCVPILRPKSFVGPERLGVFALFYDWAADGKNFPVIGSGRNRYQLLDVDDLCEAIGLCLTLPKEKVNDTFNIAAAEFKTMREDFQAVLDAAGFGKRIIGIPATPVIWILKILEALGLSPLYKWVYDTAGKDSFVGIEKAQKMLGYKPRFSNADALLKNYRWYLANRETLKNVSGVTHRVPWKQGALGIAKMFF